MALKNNTWTLNQWYDQDVAGNVSYTTNLYGLWGWGKNHYGQLAQNNEVNYSSPVQIGSDTTWKTLGVNGNNQYQGFATKTDGTLWAWGQNIHGGLGLNESGNAPGRSSPTQIPGTNWSDAIFSGTGVSFATKTDGTLWAWGNGNDGQTGLNNQIKYSSPVQIPGTTWGTTRGSLAQAAAIKTDGTLWTWGRHEIHNSKVKYSSPVQVGSGSDWSTVRSSAYGLAAVKTDGSLWVNGTGGSGQFGQNNLTEYSSPIQIPGTWKDLTGGGSHYTNAFINTDNELWVMGDNEHGTLGLNDTVYRSSPTQIPGSWDQVGIGAYVMAALKTDGTLWTWGENQYGECGQNNRTPVKYSSPVQIPGTDWDQPQGAMLSMFALIKQ